MSADGAERRLPLTAPTYERQAARLFDAVRGACDPGLGFAAQVEACLRVTLDLLAAEPQLARDLLLTLPGGAGEEIARCQHRWSNRYCDLLRHAVAADSLHTPDVDSLEPVLIGGVISLISREVATGEPERLPQLLPALLEFLLVFYLAPPRSRV